jgi:DNA polymerase-3 subunit delta'
MDRQAFLQNLSVRSYHAYLLRGGSDAPKLDWAQEMAAFFLDAPRDRLSLHPDYIALGPKKKSIGVEEIRLLKETLAKKPFSAKLRVCLVEEADTLTVQAQNAMLKMLEEPGDAVFLLLCEGMLLPTIHSRCLTVPIPSPKREDWEKKLVDMGLPQEKSRLYAAVGRGCALSPGELAEDETLLQLRLGAIEGVRRLFGKHPEKTRFLDFFKQEKQHAAFLLAVVLSFFRDMLSYSLLGEQADLINLDMKKAVAGGSRYFTYRQLQGMINCVLLCERQIQANVNYALAIENMLIGITEVPYR